MPAENPIVETAKQRSLRVALDYYRWPDPIARTKIIVSWALTIVALGYVVWLLLDDRAGGRHASPGPVAAAHATWDHQCAECHREFRPLHSDSVDFVSLFRGSAAPRAALDDACIKCHPGPIHHSNAKAGETAFCAACHRDHLGRNASIIRPADSQCTSCHADIQSHRQNTAFQSAIENVTGFGPPAGAAGPHPPFRSLKKSDPGNVKFNHWLHMQPGVAVRDPRDPAKTFHLTDITDPLLREQYKPFAPGADGVITLDCTACHRIESDQGVPSAGDYMQPIAYERHCRACHPLQVKSEDDGIPELNIPHGLSADRLTTALDGLLLGSQKAPPATSEPTADESGASPLVPGKTLGKNLAQKIGADVLRRRAKAAALINDKCSQCHYPQMSEGVSSGELPTLAPPSIPAVWLTHARFDHRAHRNLDCRTCHAAAYAYEQRDKPQRFPQKGQLPPEYSIPRDDEQVMIANLESCVACHAPPRNGQGGARHDCAECHLYHGRDHVTNAATPGGPAVSNPDQKVAVNVRLRDLQGSEEPPSGHTFFTSALQPAVPVGTSGDWIGISSCAATGCHGDARSGAPAWRSALATWTARDPHAQAYDVLWTFRGREMTRLLSSLPAGGADRLPLTDDQHFQALEQRCVGCHATPPPHDRAASPNDYQLGVHCESCHGPAGPWLHTHYRQVFDLKVPDGFIATKDLHTRAGVCMGCHVGPSHATGQAQVVDHDLIAAGHPRLSFEFHAYLNNLPPHWDAARDEKSQSGAYHFRAWLAGQLKQTEHNEKLVEFYQKEANPRREDFALLDCSACHHQLAASSWHQSPAAPGLRPGQPPPATGPLHVPQPADWPSTLSRRIQLAETLLSNVAKTKRATWDGSVQAYLTARAVAADVSPQSHPNAAAQIADLNGALAGLGRYLGNDCFVTASLPRSPNPYDTATSFDPKALPQHVQPVIVALTKLASATSAPSPP